MDIKIGLLVKNRIDVEEVVAHGKHLNRRIRDRTKSKLYLNNYFYFTAWKGNCPYLFGIRCVSARI